MGTQYRRRTSGTTYWSVDEHPWVKRRQQAIEQGDSAEVQRLDAAIDNLRHAMDTWGYVRHHVDATGDVATLSEPPRRSPAQARGTTRETRARRTSRSTVGGEPGGDEPPPQDGPSERRPSDCPSRTLGLPVTVVGVPAQSNEAVSRVFVGWLERQHPGTSWQVTAPTRARAEGGQR